MNRCNFCDAETIGHIYGGWENIDEGKNLPSKDLGYRYSCCEKCWNKMKPYVQIPMYRILKSDIFV